MLPSNWKKLLIVVLGLACIATYVLLRYKDTNSPSMPLASPPPPSQKTLDEASAIKKFSWEGIELPEPSSELFVYQTTDSLSSPTKLEELVSLLGFTLSDISISTSKQTTWSKNGAVLAISSSPQYVEYTSPNTAGLLIDFNSLTSILTNNNLVLDAPTTSAQSVYSLETGSRTSFSATIYPVSQAIDKYPVVSQSNSSLGTVVVNEKTGGLVSITISGGYSKVVRKGSVIPPTFETIKATTEDRAVEIYITENISDTHTRLNQTQRVAVNNVKIVYYSDPNTTNIVPGYLVSGKNQAGKTLNYFIPML